MTLLSYEQCVKRMLGDPECIGELLLVGIALARGLHLDEPAPVGPEFSLKTVGRQLYGNGNGFVGRDLLVPYDDEHGRTRYPDKGWKRILSVIMADARRYEPPGYGWRALACGRPRVRTAGECGRSVSYNLVRPVTDPLTGERDWVGSCTNKPCKAWLDQVIAANRAELAAHPAPRPAANTGGILERHLPELDWWKMWTGIDKTWSPPPEAEPFHGPRLTIVTGLADDDQEPAAGLAELRPRPALIVMKGGWNA